MDLSHVIDALNELREDSSVPRNVRNKAKELIDLLEKGEGDIRLRINKALEELEELANDANLQPFTRTMIWDITSMLGNLE